MLAACLLAVGCVLRHGQGYWAWSDPGYWSDRRCNPVPVGEPQWICVKVTDLAGYPLPGVTVRATHTAEGASGDFRTNDKGEVRIPAEPGDWSVRVELLGFHSGQYAFELRPDTQCCLRFQLELADSSETTVS